MKQKEDFLKLEAGLTLGHFRSSHEFAITSIRTAMIINGGAAIALLAYIGNVASDEAAVIEPKMGMALLIFVFGTFVSTAALIFGHLAERSNYQHVHMQYIAGLISESADEQDFINDARKHASHLGSWSMYSCILSLLMFYLGASLCLRTIFWA